MVLALLSDLPRTNGMQHLLGLAQWDADTVRDDARECVVAHLPDEDAVPVPRYAGSSSNCRKTVAPGQPDHLNHVPLVGRASTPRYRHDRRARPALVTASATSQPD
ncbi:hypothetical protein [Streptomyces millisiae]|uniref:hypothetical protein n=1 Tax=Streptomyces millisiae TaxID=3075542 RepID=UPI00374E1B2C